MCLVFWCKISLDKPTAACYTVFACGLRPKDGQREDKMAKFRIWYEYKHDDAAVIEISRVGDTFSYLERVARQGFLFLDKNETGTETAAIPFHKINYIECLAEGE
jgi:hypothetical protein